MKEKVKQYIELIGVFIILTIITAFANALVSIGKSIPIKMIITLLIPTIMTLIPVIVYKVQKRKFRDFGFNKSNLVKQIIIGFCIFAITITFAVILPLLLGFSKSDVLSFKASSIYILIFYIIYRLIFIGFSEEIIFRGYFYNGINEITNSEFKAVIFSSILFGLVHYPNGFNIMKVIVVSIIGLLYGFARYKIKNCTILSLSIGHGMHDAVIIVLSFLLLD